MAIEGAAATVTLSPGERLNGIKGESFWPEY